MASFRAVVLALMLLLWSAAVSQPLRAAGPHITPSLMVESPVAPGGTVMLAVSMRAETGWHGYWSNPGDAGLGMNIEWQLPPGFRISALEYPVPQTLLVSGLMNHVYKGDYALLMPLTAPSAVKPGQRFTLTGKARWLACTEALCVPEQALLQLEIVIGTPRSDPQFDVWRMALPAPLGAVARFAIEGGRIRLHIPLPESVRLTDPHFFFAEDKVADYAANQTFSRNSNGLIIEVPQAKFAAQVPSALTGVLRLEKDRPDGLTISAVPGPVAQGGLPLRTESAPVSLPLLILAALAGGLLLNIMPCVFPILSLKALSLARAGTDEVIARREGLAYTAGVVVACLALGALLLILRAGGSQIGWAFQLQEPWVVAGLLILAVVIAANLLGLFEFSVPGFSSQGSPRGAFATGLLAAFVATPCTGPFMASAIGAALLLPALPALILFAALGLGLALPFLALALVPPLRRLLPRPGAWMQRFRHWMALPMVLTALALLWLANRLGGMPFALGAAVAAAFVLLACTWLGNRQRKSQAASVPALAAAAIAIAAMALLPRIASAPQPSPTQSMLAVQPFSEAAIAKACAQGRPVFVWMTADWCLTCKVNERVAIERAEVRDAFTKAGVVVLRGDWTRRNPAITRYLTAQGAAGVPLYVWYPAKSRHQQQLPQVLTPGILVDLATAHAP